MKWILMKHFFTFSVIELARNKKENSRLASGEPLISVRVEEKYVQSDKDEGFLSVLPLLLFISLFLDAFWLSEALWELP